MKDKEICLNCHYWHPNPNQKDGMAFCTVQIGQTDWDFYCEDWRKKGSLENKQKEVP